MATATKQRPKNKPASRKQGPTTVVVAANPRRRRRHANPYANVPVMANPRRRRRSNPIILPNRRIKRRNPMDINSILRTVGIGFGSAGISVLVNRYMVSRIGDNTGKGIAIRGLARAGLSVVGAHFFPGQFGAALVGAMMYPFASETLQWAEAQGYFGGSTTAAPTSASLEAELEAELGY